MTGRGRGKGTDRGDGKGNQGVEGDGCSGKGSKGGPTLVGQDARHQAHLQKGRHHIKHLHPPINVSASPWVGHPQG